MNDNATIAWNPIKKSVFFLSLIGGLKVRAWGECQHDWLNDMQEDCYELLLSFSSHDTNARHLVGLACMTWTGVS